MIVSVLSAVRAAAFSRLPGAAKSLQPWPPARVPAAFKSLLAGSAALLIGYVPMEAAPFGFAAGYGASSFFEDAAGNNIVSYDWGADDGLYYMTVSPSFNFGGFYRHDGGGTSTLVAGNGTEFAGASVVSIGNNVYFNTNTFVDQRIYRYGPVDGLAAATQISTTANYALFTDAGGNLFITGSVNFGTNHVYFSELDASGDMTSNPALDLGVTSGNSGPLVFDALGNMYYSPGFGELSIYKWSAADVAAAISGTPLELDDHLWFDYSLDYADVSGGTSMIIGEDGDLWLTLSNFSGPSVLASFGVDELGNYDGFTEALLYDNTLLGELREWNGRYFVSSGDTIYELVPEPGPGLLLGLVGSALLMVWRRRRVVA